MPSEKEPREFECIYKHKTFRESLKSSFSGVIYTLKTERNARIILCIGIATLILATVLQLNADEFAIIIAISVLVITCELFKQPQSISFQQSWSSVPAR